MGFNKFKNAILRAGGGAPPAPVKLNIPVTLISQPSCVMAEVIFEGSTFSELKTLYYSEFYQLQLANPELKEGEKKAFFLRDKKYGVAYEGFDIPDLYANAVVCEWHLSVDNLIEAMMEPEEEEEEPVPEPAAAEPVRNPNSKWGRVGANIARISAMGTDQENDTAPLTAGTTDSASSTPGADGDGKSAGKEKKGRGKGDGPVHSLREKIWTTLDDPGSSRVAMMFTVLMLMMILFSTTTFCLETLHTFYSNDPAQTSFWYLSEAVCISIFTLELILRLLTCPNLGAYFQETMNIIDIVAIMPFYIELALVSAEVPGLAVFRVVRLVRVLRLFKMSRGSIVVFAQTMKESMKPLYMLIMLSSIAVIVASSLMWFVERGWYDEERRMWMRLSMYECEAVVVRDYPLHENTTLYSGVAGWPCVYTQPQPISMPQMLPPARADAPLRYMAQFTCPYQYPRRSNCSRSYEQSPFESIPATTWWAFVTMTTVGYGDIGPTSWLGKLLGMAIMLFGVLVIALPITVISSNFSQVYQKVMSEKGGGGEEAGGEGGNKFSKVAPHNGTDAGGMASLGGKTGRFGPGGGAGGKSNPNMMLMAALQAAQMQNAQKAGRKPAALGSGGNAFAALAMAAKAGGGPGAGGAGGSAMLQLAAALKANQGGGKGGNGRPAAGNAMLGAVLAASASGRPGAGAGKSRSKMSIAVAGGAGMSSLGAGGASSITGLPAKPVSKGRMALKRHVASGGANQLNMMSVTPGANS